MNRPRAFLFLSGQAAFFNTAGEQIPELQKLGWSGLREFLKLYPEAEVLMQGGAIEPELRPGVLRQLREPGVENAA